MDFRMSLCVNKESSGSGMRKSTISYAKCLSTVQRIHSPPIESEQEIMKKAFE
jgi:hypothetical protein